MYYYTYNTHILAAAGIVGILVIAVVLTALLAVLVLPKHKDGKLPAFFQLLFDAFTPKTLLLEKILQVLNVFFSLVAVLLGLVLIFQGLFANTTLLMMGLLLLLLGQLPQLRVGEQGPGLLLPLPGPEVGPVCLHHRGQLVLLLVQPGHLGRVVIGLRRGQPGLDLAVFRLDGNEFVQHSCASFSQYGSHDTL